MRYKALSTLKFSSFSNKFKQKHDELRSSKTYYAITVQKLATDRSNAVFFLKKIMPLDVGFQRRSLHCLLCC